MYPDQQNMELAPRNEGERILMARYYGEVNAAVEYLSAVADRLERPAVPPSPQVIRREQLHYEQASVLSTANAAQAQDLATITARQNVAQAYVASEASAQPTFETGSTT